MKFKHFVSACFFALTTSNSLVFAESSSSTTTTTTTTTSSVSSSSTTAATTATTTTTTTTTTSATPSPTGVCTKTCIRKEYNDLTKSEANRFFTALAKLNDHNDTSQLIGNLTKIEFITKIHKENAASWHGNKLFLFYHRALLLLLQKWLTQVDSSVCLPYWDHAAQWNTYQNCSIWDYVGDASGNTCVTKGLFANWRNQYATVPNCLQRACDRHDLKNVWPAAQFWDQIGKQPDNFTYVSRTIEMTVHAALHVNIGGEMNNMTSNSDPIFWLHHAYIDYIFDAVITNIGEDDILNTLAADGHNITLNPFKVTPGDLVNSTENCYLYAAPGTGRHPGYDYVGGLPANRPPPYNFTPPHIPNDWIDMNYKNDKQTAFEHLKQVNQYCNETNNKLASGEPLAPPLVPKYPPNAVAAAQASNYPTKKKCKRRRTTTTAVNSAQPTSTDDVGDVIVTPTSTPCPSATPTSYDNSYVAPSNVADANAMSTPTPPPSGYGQGYEEAINGVNGVSSPAGTTNGYVDSSLLSTSSASSPVISHGLNSMMTIVIAIIIALVF